MNDSTVLEKYNKDELEIFGSQLSKLIRELAFAQLVIPDEVLEGLVDEISQAYSFSAAAMPILAHYNSLSQIDKGRAAMQSKHRLFKAIREVLAATREAQSLGADIEAKISFTNSDA